MIHESITIIYRNKLYKYEMKKYELRLKQNKIFLIINLENQNTTNDNTGDNDHKTTIAQFRWKRNGRRANQGNQPFKRA